jgi:predicted membrane metal-binding protein
MEPATMRALFIVLLVFFSILLKRQAHLPRIVFIGAALLLIVDPLLLFHDPSFQLSMLALIGLLAIGPLIERALLLRGIAPSVVSYLAPILGAQFGVLPYLMWSTQTFALYAIPANIFILFFIGFLSVGGIAIVFAGMVIPAFFPLVALPVQIALSIVITFAHFVARLPGAILPVHISGSVVSGVYLALSLWLFLRWRHRDLSPLALFTLREEMRLLAKRKIPWSPSVPETVGINLDVSQLAFSPIGVRRHAEALYDIDWNA